MKSIILVALFLTGCSTAASVRVIEYGGSGAVSVFSGAMGGCTINQQKGSDVFASVKMTYKGSSCEAEVEVKPPK